MLFRNNYFTNQSVIVKSLWNNIQTNSMCTVNISNVHCIIFLVFCRHYECTYIASYSMSSVNNITVHCIIFHVLCKHYNCTLYYISCPLYTLQLNIQSYSMCSVNIMTVHCIIFHVLCKHYDCTYSVFCIILTCYEVFPLYIL